MATKVEIDPDGAILKVRVIGTIKPGLDGKDLAELGRILAACAEFKCAGILFDLSCASLIVNAVDMYRVGAALAEQMAPGVKMAVFYNENSTQEDPFFQVIAQNRGILYRAFPVEADALAWLNSKP